MSVALYCNPSDALAQLWATNQVPLDGVEFTSFHSPGQIVRMKPDYAGLPFQFHASNLGRIPLSMARLDRYQQLCPDSRWVSAHLSPIPAWAVYPALRWGMKLPIPSDNRMVNRLVRQLNRLKSRLTLPLILENLPICPIFNSTIEGEPSVINRVLAETGCEMLLDLAHARVSAGSLGLPVEDYLLQLPLEKSRQVHISGVRVIEGELQDSHETLTEEGYGLLDWVLKRIKPEMVTLEYFREDKDGLKQMLFRLRKTLDVYERSE
jgi:uncharacterized protein (UPF0276 family)